MNIPISTFSDRENQHGEKLREAQAEATETALKAGVQVSELAKNASGFAEAMAAKLLDPASPPTACAKGCSACCYQQVTVLAPEVIRIVDFMQSTLSRDECDRLLAKLENLDRATRGLSPIGRTRIPKPCAFLENDQCSIYSVRPMSCAEFTSYKVSDCKRGKRIGFKPGSIIHEKAKMLSYYSIQKGLKQGLEAAKPSVDASWLELTAAMVDAHRTTDAEANWLAGGNVFAKSRMSPHA
jgi:Fe-S-cluster containining protein